MDIQVSNIAKNINEYYFSKKLASVKELISQGKKIINLGIGNPGLPPEISVIETLQTQSSENNSHGYQSYRSAPELRTAFSTWYKKHYEIEINSEYEILPLQGSKVGIMYISLAFLNKDDKVLVPDPGYPAYAAGAKFTGSEIITYNLKKENNYLPDFNEIKKNDLSKVKLMWVNYPNMPTGQNGSYKLFEQLIAFGKEHEILICNDNPYSFILNENPMSILSAKGAFEAAIELNSLSKSHNMAGWRIGAVFGAKQYIDVIQKIQSNFTSGMFLPLQKAAETALNLDNTWYNNLNETYKKRRDIAWKILDKLNCSYNKLGVGMFIWAKIPENFKSGTEFSDFLLNKYELFITPGEVFGLNGKEYIRISLSNNTEDYTRTLNRITRTISIQQNQ